MKSLFQTNVMFHDSFKQRQTRTHKAVFHFKTGKFVQPNPTDDPPRMLAASEPGRAARRACGWRMTSEIHPVIRATYSKGRVISFT